MIILKTYMFGVAVIDKASDSQYTKLKFQLSILSWNFKFNVLVHFINCHIYLISLVQSEVCEFDSTI